MLFENKGMKYMDKNINKLKIIALIIILFISYAGVAYANCTYTGEYMFTVTDPKNDRPQDMVLIEGQASGPPVVARRVQRHLRKLWQRMC